MEKDISVYARNLNLRKLFLRLCFPIRGYFASVDTIICPKFFWDLKNVTTLFANEIFTLVLLRYIHVRTIGSTFIFFHTILYTCRIKIIDWSSKTIQCTCIAFKGRAYTFGNCQRPVSTFGVLYMYKIPRNVLK